MVNRASEQVSEPQVVYIAGYGRSGSTLLDCILGSHEEMVGTGELTHLFKEFEDDAKCSCLEPVRNCAFWRDVLRDASESFGQKIEPPAARILTRKVEKISPLRGGPDAKQSYLKLWRSIYGSLGKLTGRKIIVDSSKNTRITWRRASTLSLEGGMNLKAIHLVRDPRAVMFSVNRGFNDQLEGGGSKHVLGGYFRGLWGWTVSSLAVGAMRRKIGDDKVLLLRYEDLVDHPFDEIARIGAFLGISTDNLCQSIRNEDPIDPGHGVSGNRMRRKGSLKFNKDSEWEGALPGYARLAVLLVWPIARRYGYKWRTEQGGPLQPTKVPN